MEMGYHWGEYPCYEIKHTDRMYLCAEEDGRIRFSTFLSEIVKRTLEYKVEAVTSYSLKPVPVKTISVSDGRYSAEELRKILEELEG